MFGPVRSKPINKVFVLGVITINTFLWPFSLFYELFITNIWKRIVIKLVFLWLYRLIPSDMSCIGWLHVSYAKAPHTWLHRAQWQKDRTPVFYGGYLFVESGKVVIEICLLSWNHFLAVVEQSMTDWYL